MCSVFIDNMYSEIIQNKNLKENFLNYLSKDKDCQASKASTEIMLYRICNGKEVAFPFSK